MPNKHHKANKKGPKDFSKIKSPKRTLILAGGGAAEEPWAQELYSNFVKLSGAKKANIGIITAASRPRRAQENAEFYKEIFSKLGAQAEWLPIGIRTKKNSYDPKLVKKISSMTGIFFGAGNQTRYLTSLRNKRGKNTPILDAINAAYQRGIAIAGTSAGTAVQCKAPIIRTDKLYSPQGGFNFFPYGILDTHFSQRNRESRLIHLARKTNTPQACGIDEDTILIVKNPNTPEAKIEVLGNHAVHIYTNISKKRFEVTRLKAGDIYYPLAA
jgi:cyanophycinase